MELRVLTYFLAVAREQSIIRAAESLHLSQPTLSTQIRALEEELGKQLLIRGSKGTRKVTLTEEGKEFVELRVTHFHGEWASRLPDLDDAVVDEFVHAITRMQETMPGIKGVKNNGKRK